LLGLPGSQHLVYWSIQESVENFGGTTFWYVLRLGHRLSNRLVVALAAAAFKFPFSSFSTYKNVGYTTDKFNNTIGLTCILSLALDLLRSKALFQNTIDVWIMFCEERGIDWYNIDAYRSFVSYLQLNGFKMQKFPLCIKESAGVYERGRDKAKFLEELSHISTEDAGAFTLKLTDKAMSTIRTFRM
jgi:hypothetical protein